MSNGKGSRPRPPSVPADTYAANYERTFGPKRDAATGRRDGSWVEVIDDAGVAHWLYSPAVKKRDT